MPSRWKSTRWRDADRRSEMSGLAAAKWRIRGAIQQAAIEGSIDSVTMPPGRSSFETGARIWPGTRNPADGQLRQQPWEDA